MPIHRYSTTVDYHKTIGEIIALLAQHGARAVTQEYREREPVGLSFRIPTSYGEQSYALPADDEAVFRVMVRQRDAGKITRGLVTREQAKRVCWRILREWLLVQLALTELGMATLDEVMLPYAQIDGRSAYVALKEQLLLPPGRGRASELRSDPGGLPERAG